MIVHRESAVEGRRERHDAQSFSQNKSLCLCVRSSD